MKQGSILGATLLLVGGGSALLPHWEQTRKNDALVAAARSSDPVRVQALLAQGADPNARDRSSQFHRLVARLPGQQPVPMPYPTALNVLIYRCVEQDLPEAQVVRTARVLLEAGADVEAPYREGNTALMEALWGEKHQLVALLLEKGAKVNARNAFGATPLMLATGDLALVRLLLRHGADLHAQDVGGQTAIGWCRLYGRTETERALLRLGCPVGKERKS